MKKLLTSLILVLTLLMPFSMVSAKSPAPSKVTVKSLKASGTNKITLKWNKAKNASSYQISFKEGSGKWTVIATVKGSRTSYTHKASFTSGKKYTYQVKAYNASSRKYGAAKSKSITLPATPGKVQLVSARFSGKNVVIKWKKASNATEYRILYKASQKAKWKKLASVKSSSASFTYKKGKTGYYTVQAYSKKTKKTGAYDTNGLALLSKTAIATPGKPAPSPSQPSTPSAPTPQPTKPATPTPKPVAPTHTPSKPVTPTPTPQPSKPVVPTPTPQPSVVKVNSMDLSSPTLSFNAKGQSSVLSVTVLPANATNKSVVWSSSNNDVATVDESGKVTAKANGTAVITAAAADGSGVKRFCSVTVEIENVETISLAGGKGQILSIWKEDFSENIDVSKVKFEYDNSNNYVNISGTEVSPGLWTRIEFVTCKKGTFIVTAKYNGKVIKKWNVVITSDWQEWKEYSEWRKSVESRIWKSGMSNKEKLDAAESYIKTNFEYGLGYGEAYLIYRDAKCDCIGASDLMTGFAKDIGCEVKYINAYTGKTYDFLVDALSSSDGHILNSIFVNNTWQPYDACPLP